MFQATKSTLHDNHHSAIGRFSDICYLIKFFVREFAFHKQLKKGSGKSPLLDLFANRSILLTKGIILVNYISSLQGNCDIKDFSYNTSGKNNNVAEVERNDDIVKR